MPVNISNIGIVGEGKMGTNLFYYLLDFGFGLIWLCSPVADSEKIRNTFLKKINRSLTNELINETQHAFLQNNIVISPDPGVLSACDLVIEAIPEVLDLKKQFFREIDRVVPPHCILASNSSSIKPTELIPSDARKDKFIGLHFFYPVALKNIVEFIKTADTSRETINRIKNFLHSINRKYLLLKEKDSFILNKIFLDFQNEAFLIVREGPLTFPQMDSLVKEYFFPVGVFEFFDSVGIDTMLTSIRNYVRGYPHEDYYRPLINKLESMIAEGKYGQKSQSGFYLYPKEDDHNGFLLQDPGYRLIIDDTVKRLHFSYIASAKRYTVQSKLIPGEIDNALKEYFGTDKGPFTL